MRANPDIYISKVESYPTKENAQVSCHAYGEEVCVLNKNWAKAGETIHVAVVCGVRQSECSFSIRVDEVTEMELSDATPLTLTLHPNEERVVRFYVPNNPNITHITISTVAENQFAAFSMHS